MLFETIAAVSTPRGKGGIAVIRISGTDAAKVADAMFKPKFTKKYGENLSSHPPRSAVYGTILDSDDSPLDEGIAVLYPCPGSFTGEDMAEISCHGGPAVTEAVYLSAIAHGASAAGRGEFTRRAFINGKLSLTEAEAVGRLIDADTNDKVRLSGSVLRGTVSREIERISAGMLDTMTALYAAIDYPEEDVGDEGEREIANTLRTSLAAVEKLLATYKTGRAVSDGIKCVICGRPNAGKSSVFNLITGEESAIVTDIAGTTRDILREVVSFGGITLNLSDTAGLRESDDTVEKMGIDRAYAEIDRAELIIAVFDSSAPLTDEDTALISRLGEIKQSGAEVIPVINKTDLTDRLSADEVKAISSLGSPVRMSAKSGDSAPLAEAVAYIYNNGNLDLSKDAVIFDVRHRELLTRCAAALRRAVNGIEHSDPIDAVCTCAEEALAALNETDGRGIDETITDEIFRRFCVGK